MPTDIAGITGENVQTYGKGEPLLVDDNSVIEWNWGGSAGYGDPITRDPSRVVSDLAEGLIIPASAEREYGVVSAADGGVDEAATEARRAAIRRERLAAAGIDRDPAPAIDAPAAGALVIGQEILADEQAGTFSCVHCGEQLGSYAGHALEKAAIHEHAVVDIGERFSDPAVHIDEPIVWRQLLCPGCGTRLGSQVAKPGDEILAEFRLTR
jgi:N-methylhydantoinase B